MRHAHTKYGFNAPFSRGSTGPSKLLIVFVLTAIAMPNAVVQAQTPIVSPTGYYEGTAHWGSDYFTDRPAMSMRMEGGGDFWFIVNDHGELHGEGVAKYDFSFGIDWGIQAKLGISVMKVLGASLDPQVTLELDPNTAVQNYTLRGKVSGNQLYMTANWAGDGNLKLNLVGTVTGTLTAKGGKSKVGGSVSASTVVQTIDWSPFSPFGQKAGVESVVPLKKLSIYGPFAARLDSKSEKKDVSVTVAGTLVQKIDFARAKSISELAQRFPERGSRGARGAQGGPGRNGRDDKQGNKGNEGNTGESRGNQLEFRAGQVMTATSEKIQVRFRHPFSDANYSVALTPSADVPQGMSVAWGNKTAQGFTVIVRHHAAAQRHQHFKIDWVATGVTD